MALRITTLTISVAAAALMGFLTGAAVEEAEPYGSVEADAAMERAMPDPSSEAVAEVLSNLARTVAELRTEVSRLRAESESARYAAGGPVAPAPPEGDRLELDDSDSSRAEGRNLITLAVSHGRWTAEDSAKLRETLPRLSPETLQP